MCTRFPLAPCTVTVKKPAGAPADARKVKDEVPEPLFTVGGEKEAVTPAGSALAVRLTDPVNPFKAPTAMVEVADPPGARTTAVGEAERVKSGTKTIKITVAVCIKVPLTAWMALE